MSAAAIFVLFFQIFETIPGTSFIAIVDKRAPIILQQRQSYNQRQANHVRPSELSSLYYSDLL